MKIIVIGAGQGGLQAARTFAAGGYDVTVFEKSDLESLCYDWCDDVQIAVFDELNIPLPQGQYTLSDSASLVAPFSEKPLRVPPCESKRDWSMERRALSATLVDLAEKGGAKINFSAPVDELFFEGGKVCGVVVGGEKMSADLVIDSSGAFSKFRASLPKSYNITPSPRSNEVFFVYRAIMSPAQGVKPPKEHPKKVYLKHLGEDGISWCMLEPNGDVNILVGRTGELTESVLENALIKLKEENPIIGSEVRRGGIVCTIPIRYPLTRMVGEGYAAIGDAAFMTIPMIGSGITNSLRAGQMLAETVLRDNSVSVETLWKYQVKYYKEIGAGHYCVDLIKRMLLGADGEDIRYLFDRGVIDETDMQNISSGEKVVMKPAQILTKVKRGWRKIGVLLSLKSAIGKGEKAEAFARTIPEQFDEEKVSAWQKTADGFFCVT